jgi:GxxExxY protein
MNADFQDFKHVELTEQIIGAFYEVYNSLGYGFLERAYENALVFELRKLGLHVVAQAPITVSYKGVLVGEYVADILVDDKVIVDIKAAKSLMSEHDAQLLNYLKATKIEVGLLVNFGPKAEVRHKAFNNARK